MALRPIIFKEDDTNNPKKGNILPEDFSAYFSLLTGKQVGILDVLKTNKLPCTYSDIDDDVPGQVTITLNAGYISIFGRLVYIEDGTQFTFSTPVAGNGYLCLRVDLSGVGSTECEMVLIPASSGLETATSLVEDNTASYEFRLYDYSSDGSSVTLTNPTNEKIVNLKDYLNGANFTTASTDDRTTKLATTEFVRNAIDNFSPKYKQLKINATLMTESNAQATVDFTGYGIISYNKDNAKYYWQGNLRYVFSTSENKGSNFDNVDNYKILINTIDNYTNITPIYGGLFTYQALGGIGDPITAYYEQSSGKTIIYHSEDGNKDYTGGTGNQAVINITGLVLELS